MLYKEVFLENGEMDYRLKDGEEIVIDKKVTYAYSYETDEDPFKKYLIEKLLKSGISVNPGIESDPSKYLKSMILKYIKEIGKFPDIAILSKEFYQMIQKENVERPSFVDIDIDDYSPDFINIDFIPDVILYNTEDVIVIKPTNINQVEGFDSFLDMKLVNGFLDQERETTLENYREGFTNAMEFSHLFFGMGVENKSVLYSTRGEINKNKGGNKNDKRQSFR